MDVYHEWVVTCTSMEPPFRTFCRKSYENISNWITSYIRSEWQIPARSNIKLKRLLTKNRGVSWCRYYGYIQFQQTVFHACMRTRQTLQWKCNLHGTGFFSGCLRWIWVLCRRKDYTLLDIMRLFRKMGLRIFRPFSLRRRNVYNCFSHLAESGANNTARYTFRQWLFVFWIHGAVSGTTSCPFSLLDMHLEKWRECRDSGALFYLSGRIHMIISPACLQMYNNVHCLIVFKTIKLNVWPHKAIGII